MRDLLDALKYQKKIKARKVSCVETSSVSYRYKEIRYDFVLDTAYFSGNFGGTTHMASISGSQVSFNEKISDNKCEIFSVIWLDASIDTNDNQATEEKLRSIINDLRKFRDVKPCLKYIEESANDDRFILIVSGKFGQELVPLVHKLRQILSIYVYCMNKDFHKTWASEYPKVRNCSMECSQSTSFSSR